MTLSQVPQRAANAWHGVRLGQPDWSDHSNSLAFEAELPPEDLGAYMILNATGRHWISSCQGCAKAGSMAPMNGVTPSHRPGRRVLASALHWLCRRWLRESLHQVGR